MILPVQINIGKPKNCRTVSDRLSPRSSPYSYSLSCVVVGTDGAPASGVTSYDWNVLECLPRPLGIVITDSPMVEPISGEFSITVAFHDEALDEIADPAIGLPMDVDCNITLADGSTLNGDNQFTMDHTSKFLF